MRKPLPGILCPLLICSLFLCGPTACTAAGDVNPWSDEEAWFLGQVRPDDSLADVLYFVSTSVIESFDSTGAPSPRAVLDSAECEAMSHEMSYMRRKVFPDSLNFFAPFYHQGTMKALVLDPVDTGAVIDSVYAECRDAFNWYMENLNGGRPFILAGYSQGAMIVKDILKNMSDRQYSRMVAAYLIGYELTAADLGNSHIVAASGATDTGVTISFNSVCGTGGNADSGCIWTEVCSAPATCINPVNWCTDSTPAPATDGDFSLSVALDTLHNVLVVNGYGSDCPRPVFDAPWPDGCLHGRELKIYSTSLASNVLDRVRSFAD